MSIVNREYRVAGINYYTQAINKLRVSNPDYGLREAGFQNIGVGRRVYHYSYINKPVYLVPEPNNPQDPQAIMVQIAGEKVGYISASENRELLFMMQRGQITYLSAFIGGGEYKELMENGGIHKGETGLFINIKVNIDMPDNLMNAQGTRVTELTHKESWFKKNWIYVLAGVGAIFLLGGFGGIGQGDPGAVVFGIVAGVLMIGAAVAAFILKHKKSGGSK